MKIENISDLRVVIQAAHKGSLTAAAHELNMTPAGASAALKRIEAQLGTRLFERSTRVLRLTEQGRVLLDYAGRAFDLLEEAEAQMAIGQRALTGSIRLAAPSDLARSILRPCLDAFLDLHPNVQLLLHVGDRRMDVVRDEVDLAVRYGDLKDSGMVARLLAAPRAVLCAAPSYLEKRGTPGRPQDLAAHNCLTYMRAGQLYREWRFRRDGVTVDVNVNGDRSADDASLARDWALAGYGILLKTRLELAPDLASGALVALMTDWETDTYPLHALLPSARFVPHRVRALVDFFISRFSEGEAEVQPC